MRRLRRLMNTNFAKKDLEVHLTYAEKELEKSEESRRDITDYIGRLNHYRQKNSLTILKTVKYDYCGEWYICFLGLQELEEHGCNYKKVKM